MRRGVLATRCQSRSRQDPVGCSPRSRSRTTAAGGWGTPASGSRSMGSVLRSSDARRPSPTTGRADRIRLDGSDALCFGGRRLALVSGVHGQVGAEYRPRRDPFEEDRLSVTTWANKGPAGKPGSRTSSGRYSAQLLNRTAHTTPLKWHADSIRDRYGNSLDYHSVVDSASLAGTESRTAMDGRSGSSSLTYGSTRQIRSAAVTSRDFATRSRSSWIACGSMAAAVHICRTTTSRTTSCLGRGNVRWSQFKGVMRQVRVYLAAC